MPPMIPTKRALETAFKGATFGAPHDNRPKAMMAPEAMEIDGVFVDGLSEHCRSTTISQ